jgi:electron transfer flavoprotein alpha subunit
MMEPSDVLVVVESEAGEPSSLSYEVLGLARRLGDALGGKVAALVLGSGLGEVGTDLLASGADRVYLVDDPALGAYQADAWLPDVVEVARSIAPAAILIGHSTIGADLAPRLAFRLDSAVATACIEVSVEAGRQLFTRPCYGGKAREVSSFVTTPVVATIQPKTQEAVAPDPIRTGEVVAVTSVLTPAAVRTRVTERVHNDQDAVVLESAEAVVAGGGGMKGSDGFRMAHALADVLGGAVGASRVACDLGWCPASYQIGLSGRTVAPDLYLAIGISGAGQHLAGCANSKAIVAINSDPDAPIFKASRFGIVGDCHQIMPALVAAIKKIKD